MNDETLGIEAGNEIRKRTQNILKKCGPSLTKVIQRLNEGLDAEEVKTHFDGEAGKYFYSKPLIAHAVRLKAVDLALQLHDAMPSQKHDFKHDMSGNMMSVVVKAMQTKRNKDNGGTSS